MSFLKGIQNKVSNTINQTGGSGKQGEPQDDQSLVTLLDRHQRAELSILVSQITETMRNDLIKVFDEKAPPPKPPRRQEKTEAVESTDADLSNLTLSNTEGKSVDDSLQRSADEAEAILLKNATPELQALRSAALAFFDAWAESVILRVGEVVNSREQQDQHQSQSQLQHHPSSTPNQPTFRPTPRQHAVSDNLQSLYPPIPTPLTNLTALQRSAILNAILLLLLSLESYRAHSRTLLIRLCTSLHITPAELGKMEKDIALGLLKIAEATGSKAATMDASVSTSKAQAASSTARKLKIGAAGVAGAALIGITGGLAAPLLAAGVGSLMGGLGLGATAAAGYLGALAGNAALVGGLFGAYGARMTSQTMDRFAKEIEDFAFIPIEDSSGDRDKTDGSDVPPPLPPRGGDAATAASRASWSQHRRDSHEKKRQAQTDKEKEAARHRLRLTIGISGWLTEESQVTSPWLVLSHSSTPSTTPTPAPASHSTPNPKPSSKPNINTPTVISSEEEEHKDENLGAEPFALRYELTSLLALGSALRDLVLSQAWSQMRKEVLKRTVLAAVYSALMAPLAVRKILKLVDSPFGIAKIRSMKAGEVLADALIERVQGERPVSLVGMSLGGRVVYSCLLALARRKAFGLVENVVVMGAACPSDEEAWRSIRSVVSGRVVNVYSTQDYILALLYRTSSAQIGVAGLQAIEGVVGVESYDATELVGGHLKYMGLTGKVLEMVGWEDLDEKEVKKREEEEEAKKDEMAKAEQEA